MQRTLVFLGSGTHCYILAVSFSSAKQSYRNFRLTGSLSVTQTSRESEHVRKRGTKLLQVARHAKHHVSHVLASRSAAPNDTCGITHGDTFFPHTVSLFIPPAGKGFQQFPHFFHAVTSAVQLSVERFNPFQRFH
ncbi:hypothetical protein AVEN_122009-1 [Araneus ventricosus]|uniref:Uncharacterized protein n=1 Tax=Araneus ventricosus TaxID=182803 RepID=A0A4Y2RBA8_ARAVE|nr:hypothetical protein AVEN_122009-1 [Araneus ventricosus]